ncbi:MAG: hypothetical protein R2939_02220 [Kofleriaceae bacterium]
MWRGVMRGVGVAAVVLAAAPARAELGAVSLELGGDLGVAPQNLTSGGAAGVTGRASLTTTWGRWSSQAAISMYTPRADDFTAFVVSGRITRWRLREGFVLPPMQLAGRQCAIHGDAYGTVEPYVVMEQQPDGRWDCQHVLLLFPGGQLIHATGWSLGFRQVLDGKYKDADLGTEVLHVDAGAPVVAWTKTAMIGDQVGALLDVEGYLYAFASDDEIRFRPGAAARLNLLAKRFYMGPQVRIDLFTGIEVMLQVGATLNVLDL